MMLALTGIIGVCLGALLNAAWTYGLARRSERRELRTAARLLLPELLENREQLATAYKTGSWSHVVFKTERWSQHEVRFMSALETGWIELTKIYTAFDLLNRDRKFREAENDPALEGDDFDYFELTLEAADRATFMLKQAAGLAENETLRIQEFFWV